MIIRASTLKRGRILSDKLVISSESEKDKFQCLADAIVEHPQGDCLDPFTHQPSSFKCSAMVSLTNLNQLSQQISYSFIHNILSIKIPAILKHSREFVNVILLINPKPL